MKQFLTTFTLIFVLLLTYSYTKPNNNSNVTNKQTTKQPNVKSLYFDVDGKQYKRTFSSSKRILKKYVYPLHTYTFYANAPLTIDANGRLQPDITRFKTFKFRKNAKASGLDNEHVQPASRYGQLLSCWNDAKRKGQNSRVYCAKTNSSYLEYESDMHNLVPAIAEINRDRKNYVFDEFRGFNHSYGKVDFSLDIKGRRVEPANRVKGNVARISLYMNDRYELGFSLKEVAMFHRWSKLDPVTKWEQRRNDIISTIQGNRNMFIE